MLKKSLFAVFLGGKLASDRLGEDHEVVFVIAGSQKEARTLAKAKWKGIADGIHVDAIQKLDIVDGHRILLTETEESDRAKIDDRYSA
ncbi:DUF1543 domain-containing protein [Phormidesmis sp. 146-35]